MQEEPVFWLGGKPGAAKQSPEPAVADHPLETQIRAACREASLTPGDFVTALGGYGSWLIGIDHGGHSARLVWNGKDGRLVLQRALPAGGWEDLRECPVTAADGPGFAAAIRLLVTAGTTAGP
ncbi:MAG: hypothetical protein L6Q83_12060 [Gammaproteobacteria bacterium]|nr:hypothetical protein [Gammaproteobacteria bacterium]